MAVRFGGSGILLASGTRSGGLSSWTIALWLRMDSLSGTVACEEESATVWCLRWVSGSLVLERGTSTDTVWTPPDSRVRDYGVWIALAGAPGRLDTYVDGALVQSLSISPAWGTGSQKLCVGGRITTDRMIGLVAELATWSVALDAEQLRRLTRGTVATDIAPAALRYYYPLRSFGSVSPQYDMIGGLAGISLAVSGTFVESAPEAHPPTCRASGAAVGAVIDIVRFRAGTSGEPEHYAATDGLGAGTDRIALGDISTPLRLAEHLRITRELSARWHGYHTIEPVDVAIDASTRRTVARYIAERAPRLWLRGHERSGDTDQTLRHALARGTGAGWTTQYPHLSDELPWITRYRPLPNSYMSVSDTSQDWQLPSSEWTVLAWIRPEGGASQYVFQAGSWAVIYGYVSGTVEFFGSAYTGSDPRPNSQISVTTNQWTLIAYRYASGQWTAWKNGAVVWTGARTFTVGGVQATAYVGAAAPALNNFAGAVADLAIIHRALSDRELSELYAISVGTYGLAPERYIGAQVEMYRYERASGALTRAERGVIIAADDQRDALHLTVRSLLDHVGQDAVPSQTIQQWQYPLSTDVGAVIPVPYGDAIYPVPHLGPRLTDGAARYVLSAESYPDVIDIDCTLRDAWWDWAPQQAGLERATGWIDLDVQAFSGGNTIVVAGDVTALARTGVPVRIAHSSWSGAWREATILSATFSAGTTTITIAGLTLPSTVETGAVSEIQVTGSSGTVGEIVAFGAGGAKALRVSDSEYVLVAPGTGYSTGSYGAVTVTAVGSTVQIAGDVWLETRANRAELVFGSQAPGSVVARVSRLSRRALPLACLDAIGSSVWGAALAVRYPAAPTDTAQAIDGALGAERVGRALTELIDELTLPRAARIVDLGDAYAWDDALMVRAVLTLEPAGAIERPAGASGRVQVPASVRVRYGPSLRIIGTRDAQVVEQLDDYPGDYGGGPSPQQIIVLPRVMDPATVETARARAIAHISAEASAIRFRVPVAEVWHISPGEIIQLRDVWGVYSDRYVVRRISWQQADADVEAVRFNQEMQAVGDGTVVSQLVSLAGQAAVIDEPRRATPNRLRNARFAQVGGSGRPLGWYTQATASVVADTGTVGGRYVSLVTSAQSSWYDTASMTDGDTVYRLHRVRGGWRMAYAIYLSTIRGVTLKARQFDASGNVLGDITVPLRGTGEKNGLGWYRYYGRIHVAGGVAYLAMWLTIASGMTLYIDAPWYGRMDGRTNVIPLWDPGSDS